MIETQNDAGGRNSSRVFHVRKTRVVTGLCLSRSGLPNRRHRVSHFNREASGSPSPRPRQHQGHIVGLFVVADPVGHGGDDYFSDALQR